MQGKVVIRFDNRVNHDVGPTCGPYEWVEVENNTIIACDGDEHWELAALFKSVWKVHGEPEHKEYDCFVIDAAQERHADTYERRYDPETAV